MSFSVISTEEFKVIMSRDLVLPAAVLVIACLAGLAAPTLVPLIVSELLLLLLLLNGLQP